jgi:hypothetical protein
MIGPAQSVLMSDHAGVNLVRTETLIQIAWRMHEFAYRLCGIGALRCGRVRLMAPLAHPNRPFVAFFRRLVENRGRVWRASVDCIHRQTNHVFGETKTGSARRHATATR